MEKDELLKHLEEQLYFIEKSFEDYEKNEVEAKRVATNIRTLVHDTNNSTSLLKLLNGKQIPFLNTNAPKNSVAYWQLTKVNMQGNVFDANTPYVGIVGKHVIGSDEGINIIYSPIYKAWTNFNDYIDFETWWGAEIYDNKKGDVLTRKGLILNVANKDGGAHIDNLKQEYSSFKKSDILKFEVNGILQGADNIPAYPAVMQISWELFHSIKNAMSIIKS